MGIVVKKSSCRVEVLLNILSTKIIMISLILLSIVSMSSATLWPSYGHNYRYVRPYYSTYSSPSYYGHYSPRVYLPSTYNKPSIVKAAPAPVAKAAPLINTTPLVNDVNSPTTQAVLSYLSEGSGLDDCGAITKAYVNIIASGGSRRDAAAIAKQVYQQQNLGRQALSPACQAAETAWRAADASGRDQVLDAALAYINADPSDSPCKASARTYISAITGGATNQDAGLRAAESFASKISALASQGKSTIDAACAKASAAYAKSSSIPSSPTAAAANAFIQKALEVGSGYDASCLASSGAFITSSSSGASEDESRVAAAGEFIKTYGKNPRSAASSPCAAAAAAYAKSLIANPSNPTQAALFSFIETAILNNNVGVDPVCTAASEAYFDSILPGSSESEASEAAAVAYLDAVEANPGFNKDSPCGRAADAYIAQYNK